MKTHRSDQKRKLLYLLDKEPKETKGFGPGGVNCGEMTRKISISVTRLVCTDFWAWFPISGDKTVFLPPGRGRAPFPWQFYLLSGRIKEGQSAPLAPAVSQAPLTYNNQYAKAAYFGVTCSALLHYTAWVFPGSSSFKYFLPCHVMNLGWFRTHRYVLVVLLVRYEWRCDWVPLNLRKTSLKLWLLHFTEFENEIQKEYIV